MQGDACAGPVLGYGIRRRIRRAVLVVALLQGDCPLPVQLIDLLLSLFGAAERLCAQPVDPVVVVVVYSGYALVVAIILCGVVDLVRTAMMSLLGTG